MFELWRFTTAKTRGSSEDQIVWEAAVIGIATYMKELCIMLWVPRHVWFDDSLFNPFLYIFYGLFIYLCILFNS